MNKEKETRVKTLVTRIMDTASRKLQCDQGTLYLFDEKANELWTIVLQHDLISEIRLAPPDGIAGYSFHHRKIINIEDAYESPLFNKEVDKQSGYRTRSVLCMPMKNAAGDAIGVVQMINKQDGTPFDDDDIEKLKAIVEEIVGVLDKSKTWQGHIPGLFLVACTALVGWAAHAAVPIAYKGVVSPVLFVILIGIAVSNTLILPMKFLPGIRYCMRQLLRISIILMGSKLALDQIADIGAGAFMVILAMIALAFVIALTVGRFLQVHRRLSTLVAVGTAVCGGSAIAAVAPTIQARDEEFSFAISVNTLMGTIAVFIFPLIGRFFGFDDVYFGLWAGTAVNDTAQVVATGYAYGDVSGDTATVIKLTRNAMMVFIVVGVGLLFATSKQEDGAQVVKIPFMKRLRQSVPNFVIGFLLLALFNTVGVYDWISAQTGVDVSKGLSNAAYVLILLSLAGIGLGTNLAKIRQVGMNAMLVSFLTFAGVAVGSALMISVVMG